MVHLRKLTPWWGDLVELVIFYKGGLNLRFPVQQFILHLELHVWFHLGP